jgi:hypothetical protein
MAAQFVAAAVAIYIFVLGLKKQKEKENAQKIEITQDKLTYINFLLNNCFRETRSQVNNINEYVSRQRENYSKFTQYNITVKNSTERISKIINQEDYILAYSRISKDGNITNLIDLADYFNRSFDKIYNDLNSSTKRDFDLKLDFKALLDSILDNMSLLIHQHMSQPNPVIDEKVLNLNNFVYHYYDILELYPRDFIAIRDKFLTPLLKYFVNERESPEIYDIVSLASRANKALTPILRYTEDHTNEIEDIKNDIESQLNLFPSLINRLDNYLTERNLKIIPKAKK